jgi:hypothetical protein
MSFRTPNNPNTDIVILTAMANIMLGNPQNTVVSAGSVYIQSKWKMMLGAFPAIHMNVGKTIFTRNSQRTYMAVYNVQIQYYDRWDQQPSTFDQIRSNIAVDLERIKANIESNDSLTYGTTAYAVSIPRFELSAYSTELDTRLPGASLVSRTLTAFVNVLPYDV